MASPQLHPSPSNSPSTAPWPVINTQGPQQPRISHLGRNSSHKPSPHAPRACKAAHHSRAVAVPGSINTDPMPPLPFISPRPNSPAAMAKFTALAPLLAVALVLASLCVACNAARIVPEHGRNLIASGDVNGVSGFAGQETLSVVILVTNLINLKPDLRSGTLSAVPSGTSTSSVQYVDGTSGGQSGQASCKLVPGQVTQLKLVQTVVQDLGVVHLLLDFLGVKKVIALDLNQLQVSVVDGVLHAVLVFILDTKDGILHLQNEIGQCIADIGVGI